MQKMQRLQKMVFSLDRGLRYTSQNAIIHIMGTPKIVRLNPKPPDQGAKQSLNGSPFWQSEWLVGADGRIRCIGTESKDIHPHHNSWEQAKGPYQRS